MKIVFYLTTFLSLCCFYVGKSNTLLLKKVVNVTNPHLNLLNKIGYNSIIGQNILKGEKYKIEHELKNSEGIVSNSQGKSLLYSNSVLIKSDKNNDDFSNNTLTITEAFYFLDINDTLGCIQGNCKNRYGTFIWSNGFKFVGYFKKRKPYDGDLYIFRGEKTIFRSIVAGIKIPFGRLDIKDIGTISGNFINGEIIKGKFKSSDGYNEYEGEFKDDKFNGIGTLTSKIGDKYVGEFKNGKYEGQGTLTSQNGDKYVGGFKDGKKAGQGTLTFGFNKEDNVKYVGEFKNGIFEGQGTLTFKYGTKYVGEFSSNKVHGEGTMTWENGASYVGEYVDGKRHGKGTYTFPNGDIYVGEFSSNKVHGEGTMIWANGDKYVGGFKNGIFEGQGTLKTKDYYSSIGEFGNGKFQKYEGQDNLKNYTNTTYVGGFKEGKKSGQGTFTTTDGVSYVGGFLNDVRNGHGSMTYPYGEKYVGEWLDDKKSGQGTFTNLNGEKNIGKFKDNNYINQEKLDNDALIKNYIAYSFLKSILSSSENNQSSSNSSGSESYSNSSGSSKHQCTYCNGTGNCKSCSKTFEVRVYDFRSKTWKFKKESRKGSFMCKDCLGAGVKYKMNGGNYEIEKNCDIGICNSGWISCHECNSRGNGTNIGQCRECRGTGQKN